MKVKNIKLQNYSAFTDIVQSTQEANLEKKRQESADYIEYIKEHDEEAYKKYLSYSTYLKLDGSQNH